MQASRTSVVAIVALVSGLALSVGCRAAEQAAVSVDWNDTRQKMVGFGGTMGWIHPHPDKRKEVFDLLFKELGVSVLRIHALGGVEGDEDCLEPVNDNGDPNQFNWAGFDIKRTESKNAVIIKAAQERGVETIIPVSWSPPGWMKTTGQRAGGGSLSEDKVDEYAELWAAYVLGMRRQFDISFRCLSIQNEPDLTYHYPTCRFEPEFYAGVRRAVAARLQKEGLKIQVLGPDTCRIYNMPDYVKAMEALEKAPGEPILTHLYDLSIPFQEVERDPERWREARKLAQELRRPLWLMEAANYLSYGVDEGSYEEALIWAQKIHWALVEGDCEVVCYWSLFFDKKNEALVYCRESEATDYEITPKFYTSMNYYRFVRPGMVRCTARSHDADILVSAFRSEGKGEGARVIVVVNRAEQAKTVTVSLQGDGWKRYETTSARKCELTPWQGPQVVLPPQSVTTLVKEAPAAGR